MIVQLDQYRQKDLNRRMDEINHDAQCVFEASVHLALKCVEMQLEFVKSLKPF